MFEMHPLSLHNKESAPNKFLLLDFYLSTASHSSNQIRIIMVLLHFCKTTFAKGKHRCDKIQFIHVSYFQINLKTASLDKYFTVHQMRGHRALTHLFVCFVLSSRGASPLSSSSGSATSGSFTTSRWRSSPGML